MRGHARGYSGFLESWKRPPSPPSIVASRRRGVDNPGQCCLCRFILAGYAAVPSIRSRQSISMPPRRCIPGFPLDDLAPPFLVQVRDVPPVRRQVERARWHAVRGGFALGLRTRMLRGARIAVIDDVMTTGATLSECALVLRNEGGAAVVDAIVLVRQPWAMPGRARRVHGRSPSLVDVPAGAHI